MIEPDPPPGSCIRLRLLQATDRTLYRALYTDPVVMQAVGPPLVLDEADLQFARVLRHNAHRRPGHRVWVVDADAHGDGLGLAALHRTGEEAELGVMLLPNAWRRGLGTQVVARLVREGFTALDLRRITARSRLPVAGLLIPAGFELVGRHGGAACWQLIRSEADRRPLQRGVRHVDAAAASATVAPPIGGGAGSMCHPGTVGEGGTCPPGTSSAQQGELHVGRHRTTRAAGTGSLAPGSRGHGGTASGGACGPDGR